MRHARGRWFKSNHIRKILGIIISTILFLGYSLLSENSKGGSFMVISSLLNVLSSVAVNCVAQSGKSTGTP